MPTFKSPITDSNTNKFPKFKDLQVGQAYEGIFINRVPSDRFNRDDGTPAWVYIIFDVNLNRIIKPLGLTAIDSLFDTAMGFDNETQEYDGNAEQEIKCGDYIRIERGEDVSTKAGRTMFTFELLPAEDDAEVQAMRVCVEALLKQDGDIAPWSEEVPF